MTRWLLKLVGNIIYGIGWVIGGIEYKLGIVRPIPRRYRSSKWDEDGDGI